MNVAVFKANDALRLPVARSYGAFWYLKGAEKYSKYSCFSDKLMTVAMSAEFLARCPELAASSPQHPVTSQDNLQSEPAQKRRRIIPGLDRPIDINSQEKEIVQQVMHLTSDLQSQHGRSAIRN